MQSLDYIKQLKRLTEVLCLKEFLDICLRFKSVGKTPVASKDREQFSRVAIDIIHGMKEVNSDEKQSQIMKSLGLDIFDDSFLARIISLSNSQPHYSNVIEQEDVRAALYKASNTLLFLKSLIEFVEGDKFLVESQEQEILQFVVVETAKDVSLADFKKIISDLVKLLNAVGEFSGVVESARVAFVDSGSLIKIAIRVNSSIAKYVNELIFGIWDRRRFSTIDKYDRSVDSMLRSMTLISEIDSREKAGILTADQSARLKSQIVSSCSDLMTNGVVTQLVLDSQVTVADNIVMIEEQRKLLLDAPKDEDNKE